MIYDNILIPFNADMTLQEALDFVYRYKAEHPNEEVFMDGDAHAIVSRMKVKV